MEEPFVKSSLDFIDKIGWTSGLWKDGGRLFLTSDKFQALGEFLVKALELENWPNESIEELEERQKKNEKVRKFLKENDLKDDLYSLNKTLLSIYISLKKQVEPKIPKTKK